MFNKGKSSGGLFASIKRMPEIFTSKDPADVRKKYIIIASFAVAILLGISIFTFLSNSSDEQLSGENAEPEVSVFGGTMLRINNFSDVVETLPNLRRDLIETILYGTVENNSPDEDMSKVKDVVIREGSYKQTYDEQTQIYDTKFLVDIPSLKRTYQITDKFSFLPREESNLYDYTTLVLCPEEDQLIFGKFECTDRLKAESNGV